MPRAAARLPVPRTPTFGRDELIDAIVRSLDDPDTRLVTLTGLGGSGKTRAATLAAATAGATAPAATSTSTWSPSARRPTTWSPPWRRWWASSTLTVEPDERPLVVLDNVDACPEGSEAVSRLLDELPALRCW